MNAPIRLLGAAELSNAVTAIDAVDVVCRSLVAPLAERVECTLRPWPASEAEDTADFVLVEDFAEEARFLVSAGGLRAVHAAALATLAARELLTPGAVRSAVVGAGEALRPQLTMIVRRLPTVRHITVFPAVDPIDRDALDQIDLTSVTVSATDDITHALDGARLVIATGGTDWPDTAAGLADGATVVNVGGQDLPRDLVEAVDQIFVDEQAADLGERYGPGVQPCLADVITGIHPGRTDPDGVVLVELPSAGALDLPLASTLHRAARDRGLWSHRLD